MTAANRRILCLVLSGFVGGCALPSMPPPLSSSRWVRFPEDDHATKGQLSLTGGGAYASGTGGQTVIAVAPEGGISLKVGEKYDLGLGLSSERVSADGLWSVWTTPSLRVGIVHGAGFGFIAAWDSSLNLQSVPSPSLALYAGPLGVMQVGAHRAIFGAVRYGVSATFGGSNVIPTHFVAGSVGYVVDVAGLHLSPEVAVAYALWGGSGHMLIIAPGVGASVAF